MKFNKQGYNDGKKMLHWYSKVTIILRKRKMGKKNYYCETEGVLQLLHGKVTKSQPFNLINPVVSNVLKF
jgi:hypothetical protein